jgi:hypothetical protein
MSHGFTFGFAAQAGSVFNKGLNASRVCTLKIDLRILLIRSREAQTGGMQMLGLPTLHGRFWQQLSPLQLVVIMIGKAIMI